MWLIFIFLPCPSANTSAWFKRIFLKNHGSRSLRFLNFSIIILKWSAGKFLFLLEAVLE